MTELIRSETVKKPALTVHNLEIGTTSSGTPVSSSRLQEYLRTLTIARDSGIDRKRKEKEIGQPSVRIVLQIRLARERREGRGGEREDAHTWKYRSLH